MIELLFYCDANGASGVVKLDTIILLYEMISTSLKSVVKILTIIIGVVNVLQLVPNEMTFVLGFQSFHVGITGCILRTPYIALYEYSTVSVTSLIQQVL